MISVSLMIPSTMASTTTGPTIKTHKVVNHELVDCALEFQLDGGGDDDDFDFESFGASQSADPYAIGCGMRLQLGSIGAAERVERARREAE